MQRALALLALLLLLCSPQGTDGRRAGSSGAHRAAAATGSPVEKVVLLMKDLKSKIEQDGENEQKIYDKYACFCDNALKGKADAIETAQAAIRKLGQEILKLRGLVASLTAKITELKEDIRVNLEAQAEKTAIRQKENGVYMAETTELKEALVALEKSVLVLQNGTSPALIQGGGADASSTAAQARAATKAVLKALPTKAALDPAQLSQLMSFMQAGEAFAPQSTTVQGILRDMYDTFAADLETSTANEAKANRDFEVFIHLKTEELKELREELAYTEKEKVEAEQQLAEATSLYDTTEEQMKADIKYFDVTKAGCMQKYSEWSQRSELRGEELEGIEKALTILTADESRALFGKAIKAGKEVGAEESYYPSLLQVGSDGTAGAEVAVSRAYAELRAQASSAHSFRLAQLAVLVRSAKYGHFQAVIKAIDEMIRVLKEEDAADIAKRDQCKEEYKQVDSTLGDLAWKIKNNEAVIAKLDKKIEQRDEERLATIEEIQKVEEQMQAMTEQRRAENKEFQEKKEDDETAISLLKKAKAELTKYYANNKIEMGKIQGSVKGLALQQEEPEFKVSQWQAPDATFSDKGNRKFEAKDIFSIMTYLIEDLTDEIRNGMKDEEETQLQYEKAMEAARQLQADLQKKERSLEVTIARLTEERGEERGDLRDNSLKHENEVEYKQSITPDCDWILGAFEGRAKRRTAEMNGLSGAKDQLVGASEAALLQKGSQDTAKTDDTALGKISFLGLSA